MFLQPTSLKFKNYRKGKITKLEFKSNKLKFGTIGLKCIESGIITARQLESARQSIVRKTNRKIKLWIRIYPNLPITAKPSEVRMGKGKGAVHHWAAKVKAGQVIFEMCCTEFYLSTLAFNIGKSKLPLRTKIFF